MDVTDPSALVQGLLGTANGGGSYWDPSKVTPQQVQSWSDWGSGLQKPITVRRPMQGINELVNALVGGNAQYQADTARQGAIANAQQEYAAALKSGQGGEGVAAGSGSDGSGVNAPASIPQGDVADYITAGAKARGINPQTALSIFNAESGLNPFAAGDKNGSGQNSSFGVTQLHYGSSGGGSNSGQGLGDEFTAKTGLDARNPANWKQAVDFSLDKAAQGGWGPWHAAQRLGIGNQDGIGANSGGGSSGSQQLAEGLANYRANGIDPNLASAVANNPWSTPEAKMLVQGLVNPQILKDGYGNQYYVPPGRAARPVPGMGPGVLPGSVGAGGASVPTVTTATPGPNPSLRTQPLIPNAGAGGGDPQHPLAAIAPVVHDAQQLNAEGTQTQAQAGDDVAKVNAYGADGVRAKGALAQLNAIDAAGQQAPSGVAGKLQEILGHYGVDAGALGPLESYKSAIDAFAPNNPVAGQFKAALGGMLSTPEGRQAAVANMKMLAQYQQQIGDIANDRSLPYSARMTRIQSLAAPKLSLPGQAAPQQQAFAGPAQAPAAPDALAQARAAIARGAPKDAVMKRLHDMGVDGNAL